jgi:hypothetical protein
VGGASPANPDMRRCSFQSHGNFFMICLSVNCRLAPLQTGSPCSPALGSPPPSFAPASAAWYSSTVSAAMV